MKFVIITNVIHIKKEELFFGYAPYIREMNIWLNHINEVIVVGPLSDVNVTEIDISYQHKNIDFRKVPDFNFIDIKNIFLSVFKMPLILWRIFWAMKNADHIHLRCPGNMGLLGCIVQIFFPTKIKTAKYAGNWDQSSKQPWTYKLQKWILNNSFLTRNIKVLVYGEWQNQSENIKPFFTATYREAEKKEVQELNFNAAIEFVFVGSLVVGKNPDYAVKLIEKLIKSGKNATLNIYGEGIIRAELQKYINENQLEKNIILHGNQNHETIKKAYQKSHFVILPSKSEGWPKAIAEGMFWGCVPLATKVSCVPYMLDYGKRGVLLKMNLENDLVNIEGLLSNEEEFFSKRTSAVAWSQNFTVDVFEDEIIKLISI